MASAEEEQVDLVPEWLAKGLHSPGPHVSVGGTRDSRHGRGSSSSNRGLMTPDSPFLQQYQSSTPHGVSSLLTASGSEERPAGWSPKTLQHHSAGFGGNHQRSSHHGSSSTRGPSYEERHHTLSSPFSPTGNGGSSSSSQFWPHKGSASISAAPSSSSTRNTADRGNSSISHGQGQRFGLQRTLSEGSSRHAEAQAVDDVHHKDNAHHSSRGRGANGAAARKLELNPSEFPSLGASSSSKQTSPEPYTPSLAPYKQGFLASRGSAGWTSKLADVPAAATADGTQPDAETHSNAQHRAASAANANSNSSSSAAGKQGGDAGAAHAAPKSGSAAAAANNTGVSPAARGSSRTAGAAAVQSQPSLADTLKQAVAASTGNASSAGHQSDARRRHSKNLVPLLPGCKAKHVGTTTRTVPAPISTRLSAANGSRAAAADLQSPTGHVPLLTLTHSSQGSSNTTAGLLHHTAADQGAAAADAGMQGSKVMSSLQSPVAVTATGSSSAAAHCWQSTSTAVSQSSKLAGGGGSAETAEQRQQLRDRNSFFAVLRRKTTSTSSTGSAGEQGGSDGGLASRSSSSSSDAGGAVQAHPICTNAAATTEPEEKGGTSSNTAALAVACPTASPAVADVDGAKNASNAADYALQLIQQQQQQQQCDVASGQEQIDVHAVEESSVVTATEHEQNSKQLPEKSVSSHPISASSSQDEEHFEALTTQQENSCEKSRALFSPSSPQKESSSNSTSILWDMPAEEEAFLRSLGWTAELSDDESEWGLTEEEIAAFQAEAAARAALQQQQRHQEQQQQQERLLVANRYAGASRLQLQHKPQLLHCCDSGREDNSGNTFFSYGGSAVRGNGVWGVGMNSSRYVRGSGVGRQAVLLFGAHMVPAAAWLGYDGYNDSSSSSSDEDDA